MGHDIGRVKGQTPCWKWCLTKNGAISQRYPKSTPSASLILRDGARERLELGCPFFWDYASVAQSQRTTLTGNFKILKVHFFPSMMPMGGCVLHGVPGYQPHRPLRSFLKIWWWQGGRKRRETGGLHVGGVSASYITSLYFIMFVTIEHILHISDFQTQVQSLSQGGWGPGPEWESSSRFWPSWVKPGTMRWTPSTCLGDLAPTAGIIRRNKGETLG